MSQANYADIIPGTNGSKVLLHVVVPNGTNYSILPVEGTSNADGTAALAAGGGASNTVAATNAGTTATTANPIQGVTGGVAVPVSGTFWQSTQAISVAALPLPAGAATSAKQPAIGTAGSASADVCSVQGIAGMTPVTVSPAAQSSTSGTVAANATGVAVALPPGCTAAVYVITGTWVGTLSFQVSFDNITWITAFDYNGSSSTTVNKSSTITVAPYQYVRVQATAWTSGTASITVLPIVSGANGIVGTIPGRLAQVGSSTGDANSLQTALYTSSYGLVFNGTNYDRVRSDATGKAQVSLYGTNSVAGDTALSLTSAGTSGTSLVTVQGSATGVAIPVTTGTPAPFTQTITTQNTTWNILMPSGCSALLYTVTGSWSGQIYFYVSYNGVLWLNAYDMQPNYYIGQNLTNLIFTAPFPYFRFSTGALTGSVTISAQPLVANGLYQNGYTPSVPIASLPALPAGGNSIGQVGGKTAKISVSPTVTASSAYAAKNIVGGPMTFSAALLAAGSGVLESITLKTKTVQPGNFVLSLFDANPVNSTWNDKTAAAINVADIPFHIGDFTLSSPSSQLGTETIYNFNAIGKALKAGATTLYGILTCVGTPTFGSTSDVTVVIEVLQD
jgi:hypothetical protein